MSKMTVIQLLNKIANGEVEENKEYLFYGSDYCTIRDFFNRYIVDKENLNLKVETLGEDNNIEKLEMMNSKDYLEDIVNDLSTTDIALDIESLRRWINKIIDKLNKGE